MPQYAAHGFVGLEYQQLYSGSADIDSFTAEQIVSSFLEEIKTKEGSSNLDERAITQVIEEQLGEFVNVRSGTANGDRRLSSKSEKSGSELDLVLSSCFCDYTADAISCDAKAGERGVLAIGGYGDSKPLFTWDLNYSGLGYLAISAACFDSYPGGQGPVSDSTGVDNGYVCYSNNEFGKFYDGKFEVVYRVFTRELFCLPFGCDLTKIHLAPFPVRRPVSRLQRAFQA